MERANITHFHKVDENNKYMLLIVITSNKNKNSVNLELCFHQGLNTWRVNDPDYRLKFKIEVLMKENKELYIKLLNNQLQTNELIDLVEQQYPGYIQGMKDMLTE